MLCFFLWQSNDAYSLNMNKKKLRPTVNRPLMSVTADVNAQASVLHGKHNLHAEQPVLIMKLDVSAGVIRAMIACFDEDTNNKKIIVLRKLTSFISLPFFFSCQYLHSFRFRVFVIITWWMNILRWRDLRDLQQWWNIHLIHLGKTLCICRSPDTCRFWHKVRQNLFWFCVWTDLQSGWCGDWQNFCNLEFCIIGTQFEGWLFRTVFVSRCLAPWSEKGDSKLSNKSHMSPQELLVGHSCGQNYITVGKKIIITSFFDHQWASWWLQAIFFLWKFSFIIVLIWATSCILDWFNPKWNLFLTCK